MQDNLFTQGPPRMTLAEFTAEIGNAIRKSPVLRDAWVTAELSDVRVNGGHCYMEMIEKNQQGQTIAKLRATVWANTYRYLREKFLRATGSEIRTGLKVMVRGAASHHTLYGLSFSISDIDPTYTLGDMERLRREILNRLFQEGLINRNKEIAMPPAPQRIAVVSAEGAAGYGDFINHLEGNTEGFVFYPVLFPAVMQGERTSASVRAALDLIESHKDKWDCVAIVRGGGATTDLNGFDDYELARRVATFPLPVVVGIGHERDRTVLDEIANTRLKTPTAVASFFVDRLRDAYNRAGSLVDYIATYSQDRIIGERRRLDNIETMIPALTQARISAARALLEREMTRIPVLVESRIAGASSRLETIGRVLGVLNGRQIQFAGQRLENLRGRLEMAAENILQRSRNDLTRLEGMVGVLSPANTLSRGYSITRRNGRAVTDASQLKPGERITTELRDGSVDSIVE